MPGFARPIVVRSEPIGARPGRAQPVDAPIILAASHALRHVGFEPILSIPASTDSNVAISPHPGVTLGPGRGSGENHTVKEWFNPKDAYRGVQKNLKGGAGVEPCRRRRLVTGACRQGVRRLIFAAV